MTSKINITENIEQFQVYNDDIFDQPRINHNLSENLLKNKLKDQLKWTLETTAEFEAEEQIGAHNHERSAISRQDYRNGYRKRMLGTSMGTVELKVPRARKKSLSYSIFQKYKRRWKELDELLLEAHIGGLSSRDVSQRIASLLGASMSATTVAKLKTALIEELKKFKSQPLKDDYRALILDGMYVKVKQCGRQKRPLVVVVGIKNNGESDLLGIRLCYSENSTEIEGILKDIKDRGVKGYNLQVVTIDGNKGLEAGVYSVYGNVRIQDCIFHRINRLHQNSGSKKRARIMMTEASDAFNQRDTRKTRKDLKSFCEKWRCKEPKAIERFEHELYRSFEANILPLSLKKMATTTGKCEGLFSQLRAKINKIGAFETPMSVELYIYAIVCQKKWLKIAGKPIGSPLLSESTHFS